MTTISIDFIFVQIRGLNVRLSAESHFEAREPVGASVELAPLPHGATSGEETWLMTEANDYRKRNVRLDFYAPSLRLLLNPCQLDPESSSASNDAVGCGWRLSLIGWSA